MTMKLYQPVLFVGLGGTGCDIGAELERRMRDEICGPDGNDFRKQRGKEGMLPYQLPSCVQFVYADMNQAELDRLPARVVPGPEHFPAVKRTAHYVTGLVPEVDSYPQLAANLRLEAGQFVTGWLPPDTPDEPKVNPLHKGAGQFPTIGRAALFGTFHDDGTAAATRDLHDAIGKLANSGEDLDALAGKQIRGVDVFVAFSVAGGTGCGIFYDYVHLIAHTLQQASSTLRVKIYPLVLMPSAFQDGLGGGRAAELNAGRALLDLFRLVDQQNGAGAQRRIRSPHDQQPVAQDEMAVAYPGHLRIEMRPGIMQTGFLFSRPAGAAREDMHRSIVSLVMSLVGTELGTEDNRSGEHHQSFADSFVNKAAHRQVAAANGIGNRGVSTALVASLSVPIDELSEVVGARLLRTAIEQISVPNTRLESNRDDMNDFLTRAGLQQLLQRPGVIVSEPEPAHGARAVAVALSERADRMRSGIETLRRKLDGDVPKLVAGFHPEGAARDLLSRLDVFRVQRLAFGHPDMSGEVEQTGVYGLLHRRRQAPVAGFGPVPPTSPPLKDKFMKKIGWNDPDVITARNYQNSWYEWQTHVTWATVWEAHAAQWMVPVSRLQRDLAALTRALLDFARKDAEDFPRRSAELYRDDRVGVSYLLPSGAGRMEQFYQHVVRRMLTRKAQDGVLSLNSTEADLVRALVGADTWPEAFRLSIEQSPGHAVSYLREKVQTEIQKFLREPPPGEQPMLPRMQDLLLAAAGHGAHVGPSIEQDYLDGFAGKLAGMLPANFSPQGSGPLEILVNYPADSRSEDVEDYLRSKINLPKGPRITEDYRPAHTETLSVVLFRTGMGVTEVDEVRDVLRRWAGALTRYEPTDLLRWRQRTGYDYGYLATREVHRVEILHRLLCALWNGRATVEGPEASPDRLNVTLDGGFTMTLPLTPLGRASSWGSLVRAYEVWALDDDDLHRRFCGQLMKEFPDGVNARPKVPDRLYQVIRDHAEGQIEVLGDMIKKQPEGQRTRASQMISFWKLTLPAALDQEFTGVDSPVAPTLRLLETEANGEANP